MSIRHTLLAGLAIVIIAGGANAARAAEIDTNSLSVSTSGLDLRTPLGAKALRQRVITAAHQVCINQGERDPASTVESDRCWRAAYDKAVPQMHAVLAKAHMTDSTQMLASAH